VSGEQRKIIHDRYLVKYGSSREDYQLRFPGAPLKSLSASQSYRNAALNDNGMRSETMTKLNTSGPDSDFQKKRYAGHQSFLDSDDSKEYREYLSGKAKKQHADGGLDDSIRNYFETIYRGSDDQLQRRMRLLENNPSHNPEMVDKAKETYIRNHDAGLHDNPKGTKKKIYKDTTLTYQSSYEYHFLQYCENNAILHLVKNAKTMRDAYYPKKYYLPDFILANDYVVEIKSWYIEKLGYEKLGEDIIVQKKALVERQGLRWLYILDKDYAELESLIATFT
jgi:hypothetical protein